MLENLEIWAQGLVVLACIGIGARMGGVAVGLWGGIGVLILAAVFHLPVGKFPVAAMSIIFAVVTASGAMQVAGGVDYLVSIAHRILRYRPRYITYLAPYVSWIFTIGAGTGNIYYSLLPVIEEVSYNNKIRPERPLALSPEASQLGITSSPVSAAMAIMVGLLAPVGFELHHILSIVIPSTVVCIFVAAFVQNRRGKPLDQDKDYLELIETGQIEKPAFHEIDAKSVSLSAKRSTWIFLLGICLVTFLGFATQWRPHVMQPDSSLEPMGMTHLITVVMMLTAILILVFGKVRPENVPKTSVFQSGMVSILALMGIAWMANTFIGAHKELLSSLMLNQVQANLWLLPIAFYITAALTTSQSSTTLIIVPVALALGIAPHVIVASWLAVIGIHFFPANGSQIATVQFDRSRTTRIGPWVLNHSFLVPNIIVATVSVLTAFIIVWFFF